MNEYLGSEESSGIMELVLVVLFAIIGFTAMGVMIVNFTNRINNYERYDKIAAGAMWEDANKHTYVFNGYQAYMMGYFIEPWGPPDMEVLYTSICNTNGMPAGELAQHRILLSSTAIGNNKTLRNNKVSGANNTKPSVRSVLDEIKGAGLSSEDFYRNAYNPDGVFTYKDMHLTWYSHGAADYLDPDWEGVVGLTPDEVNLLQVRGYRWCLEEQEQH